jgi:membrane protease YdiL (CAAX protease family)
MSLLFLIIVVALLPYLSAISYKNIKKLEAMNEGVLLAKTPIYLQSIAMQVIISIIAFVAARFEHIKIQIGSKLTVWSLLAGLLFLVLALSLAWITQKQARQTQESTLKHLLPDTTTDRIVWVFACLAAAFCEEYIYRGVLFQMMQLQTGQIWILSAIISAVVFAFGHGTQGERAILQIIPFALGFHLLAYWSNGLLLPMIVHFLYNVMVELLFGEKIKKSAS